jgi:hypothetical protein
MAKVEIALSLLREIEKKFKGEAHKIVDLLETLEENPRKGKLVGQIEGIIIKEIKYKSFRFYFIADGFKLKFLNLEELSDLLIKFIRMSDKKDQQKIINEIKDILRKLGEGAFE